MRRPIWIGLGLVFTPILVVLLAAPKFLPERSQTLRDSVPGNSTIVGTASWMGRAGHSASGTITFLVNASGAWLRFEDFEMTAGPAVFLYLSQDAEPDSRDRIKASWRLPIDCGAEGGLPHGLDVQKVRGLGAWCDDFSVPFGVAALA